MIKMELYEDKLLSLIQKNDRIMILTAENRVSLRNLPDKIPDNFVDVGISEQNLVGISAGLAKQGFLPIIHGMAAFLTMRAFEFIRTDLGYPNLPSVLVGSFTGLSPIANGTANGPTHQAIEDIGLMKLIPNMTIFSPSDMVEKCECLDSLDQLQGPMYLRDSNFENLDYERKKFEWGKNDCIKKGNKTAILTYGFLVGICLKVSNELVQANVEHSVYNMRFIQPMDLEILNEIFTNHETIIVIEDHIESGSLYESLLFYKEKNNLTSSIFAINLKKDFFHPGNFSDALNASGFTTKQLSDKILSMI